MLSLKLAEYYRTMANLPKKNVLMKWTDVFLTFLPYASQTGLDGSLLQ